MFYQTIKDIRSEFRRCPSLGPLLLLGLGEMGGVCELGWRGWIPLVHVSFWVSCLYGGRRWWMAWMLFFFGVWWGARMAGIPADSYARLMGREECRVCCTGIVSGCPLPGEPFDFALDRMETPDGWHRCSGRVRLRANGLFSYGDRLRVTGAMMYPEAGFQRRHLKTLGIRHELEAEKIEKLGSGTGWRGRWGRFLEVREKVSEKLTEGFRSDRLGGLYLAMSMGRRDLFPRAERELFVRSATIHVFAISGLHVNCLMLSVCVMLRVMCFGRRAARLAALPFIILYVLLTGPGPSSARAVLMLGGSTLALCLLRRGSDRHVYCLSALALLLYNPLYLLHIGFQFSFLIVGVLVYGQPAQGGMERVMTERWRWRRKTEGRLRMFRFFKHVLSSMLSCFLAWTGCLALTLSVNRLMPLGAVAVNMIVQPLAALLVEGAVPKILLSCVWGRASCWMGRVLEIFMEWTVGLAEWGAREELCLLGSSLPLAWACVYVMLFALLLVRRGGRIHKMCIVGGMALIITGVWGERRERQAELMMFRADTGSRTCLVMLESGWNKAFVLVPGCDESAKMAIRWLKRNGVTTVESMFVSGGVMRKGMKEWLNRMHVRSIVMDEEDRLRESIWLAATGTHVSHWRIGESDRAEYHQGFRIWRMLSGHDGTSLRIEGKNGRIRICFDEIENGLGLLSFQSMYMAGNKILKAGSPGKNERLRWK